MILFHLVIGPKCLLMKLILSLHFSMGKFIKDPKENKEKNVRLLNETRGRKRWTIISSMTFDKVGMIKRRLACSPCKDNMHKLKNDPNFFPSY